MCTMSDTFRHWFRFTCMKSSETSCCVHAHVIIFVSAGERYHSTSKNTKSGLLHSSVTGLFIRALKSPRETSDIQLQFVHNLLDNPKVGKGEMLLMVPKMIVNGCEGWRRSIQKKNVRDLKVSTIFTSGATLTRFSLKMKSARTLIGVYHHTRFEHNSLKTANKQNQILLSSPLRGATVHSPRGDRKSFDSLCWEVKGEFHQWDFSSSYIEKTYLLVIFLSFMKFTILWFKFPN